MSGEQDQVRKDPIGSSSVPLSTAQFAYSVVADWIRTADTKAGLQLTASGLLVGILTDGLTSPESVLSTLGGIALGLVVGSYALLILAVVLDLIALGPRLNKSAPGQSLVYFRDIASTKQDDYVQKAYGLTSAEWCVEYMKQVHELSTVADRKHAFVQRGTAAILGAAILGVLAWIATAVA